MVIIVVDKNLFPFLDGSCGADSTNVAKARREGLTILAVSVGAAMICFVSQGGAVDTQLVVRFRDVDADTRIPSNCIGIITP